MKLKGLNYRLLKQREGDQYSTRKNSGIISDYYRPFVLDCCKFSQTLLPNYEGLTDPLLGDYFRKPKMRHHLMQMKLVQLFADARLINMENLL